MNDERMESEIRAALLRDDPGLAPASLQRRVDAVPDERAARRRSSGWPHASRIVASIEAIAAVLAVAALVGTALFLRGSSVGPGRSGSATTSSATASPSGATPSGKPVASPTTLPTGNPPASSLATLPAPTPVPGWTALSWSSPGTIPGAIAVDDLVIWNGAYIAEGQAMVGGAQQTAFWRSTDGTTWTLLNVAKAGFTVGNTVHLVVGPSELVVWGTVGQPTCTGQGEGQVCGSTPVMIWTSANGTDWARVADVSMFAGATVAAVTNGAHGLVAVGALGTGKPAVWVSSSGTSWRLETPASSTYAGAYFSDVQATAHGYVVAGTVGGSAPVAGGVQPPSTGVAAAWWSTNGSTWTRAKVNRKAGVGVSLGSIYVGVEGLVAVGSANGGQAGAAWTSTDGHTWQPIAVDYLGAPPVSGTVVLPSFTLTGDGTRLVAYAWDGQSKLAMWISPDGVTWQPLTFTGATGTMPGAAGYGTQAVGGFHLAPGGLIVTGQHGSSTQGVVWRVTAQP